MSYDPEDDQWVGRDRFVLSCGHSSLTLYIQLFLSGYGLELDDLKALRTWGSLTPGHPEYRHTKGVEITTGPLGQGLATSVGFAYGQRRQRGMFDADAPAGTSPFDHTIWVIASDGANALERKVRGKIVVNMTPLTASTDRMAEPTRIPTQIIAKPQSSSRP